jgi:uncharacterized protein
MTLAAIVIVDTSVLKYLHLLGLLDLLEKLFLRVIVPDSVVAELDNGRAEGHDLPDPRNYPWMELRATPQGQLPPEFSLDPGETSVLLLALAERPAVAVLLLDDWDARQAAGRLEFFHPGTLAILQMAKEEGFIPLVRPCIERLRALKFRASEGLYSETLADVGEPDSD